jgi:hypothetical protein
MTAAFLSDDPEGASTATRSGQEPRLQVVPPYIKNGIVLFLRSLSSNCPGQTFDLGVESHDDLNNTLGLGVQGLANRARNCGRSVGLRISPGK